MNAFLFSYGGNNDMGEIITLGKSYEVDFPKENETCYGLAFRRDVDISFCELAREITIEFETEADLNATIEFKTVNSSGTPEEIYRIMAKKGNNKFSYLMPALLSSKITEIVFCIPKHINQNLKTSVNVIEFCIK